MSERLKVISWILVSLAEKGISVKYESLSNSSEIYKVTGTRNNITKTILVAPRHTKPPKDSPKCDLFVGRNEYNIFTILEAWK